MAFFPTYEKRGSQKAPPPSNDYWYHQVGATTTSGVKVSEATAMKYLTLFACVSLIAGDIGRLPLILYRKRADGSKERVTNHPLYDVLHSAPNPDTDSFHWREAGEGHCLLWGNHYSFIERNKMDEIKALWQLSDPGGVAVTREGNALVYSYRNGDGEEVKRRRDQIFHVPGFGFNGVVGLSMLTIAQEAIGMGLATEQFGAQFFGQGTHPAGLMEMEGFLGDRKTEYLKSLKEGYSGLGKSHSIMVVEGGAKYKPLTIPLNDAQFLETRSFQKIEICGMYHVPPHKIAIHGQNSNYNNLEQENASYVDSCLSHWVSRWEGAIQQQLLTKKERAAGLYVEFLMEGLLRGDSAARAAFYKSLFEMASIKPNEIRQKENMNPIAGGDETYIMMNMVPLKMTEDLLTPDTPVAPDAGDFEENSLVRRRNKFNSVAYLKGIDRIRKSFYNPLLDAAQMVINRETKAVKAAVKKELRSKKSMEIWLAEFYTQHEDYVRTKLSPILISYQANISGFAGDAIGVDFVGSGSMEKFFKETTDVYVAAHVRSSKGQIAAIIRDMPLDELADAIDQRMDEWFAKRAPKITKDELVRKRNAAALETWTAGGVTKKQWVAVGKSCPFCNTMNGKIVGVEENYLSAGEVLYVGQDESGKDVVAEGGDNLKNVQALKSYGNNMHPPIHQGCDCIVVPVI